MRSDEVVEIRMRVAARPSTLYRFLTDPDRFRAWMGENTEFAGLVGGALVVRYPDGGIARGIVLEMVPDERLVFSWGYDGATHGIGVGTTRVTIELVEVASGTLVTLRHEGIPSADGRRDHRMGWRHYLSALGNAAAATAGHAASAIELYHTAWRETDDAARLALLERCWAADGIFRDAMGYAEGRDELASYIGAAQRFAPNLRLEADGPVRHSHGAVLYRWRIVAPDGTPAMTGSNVGELAPDGRLLQMTGFWDSGPPPA